MNTDPLQEPSSPVRRQAREWVMRLAVGEVDEETLAELSTWRRESTDHNAAFEEERRLYRSLAPLEQAFAAPVEPAALLKPRRRIALASVTGAALTVALSWLVFDPLLLVRADHITQSGEVAKVVLPDGSRALLNSESAIDIAYDHKRRRIRLLNGEAWFDVEHDPAHPFVVEAEGAAAEALGTAYAVRRGGDGVTLAVTQGMVEFSGAEGAELRVKAGEGARIERGRSPRFLLRKADDALAWRSGRIIIEDRSLAEVAEELARYRRGSIVVLGAAAARRVSGVLEVSDIDRGLEGLAAAQGLSVTHVTPWLVVLR